MTCIFYLYWNVPISLTARILVESTPLGGPVTTEIRGRLLLPGDNSPINTTTRITINDGEYITHTKPDGSFIFHNVGPGTHLLQAQSLTYLFSQVKIQLLESAMSSPKCIEYVYPGATKQAIPHPLILTAHAKYDYFEKRQGFSLLAMLKNPMVLMMLFSVVLMFMMPKMLENLDPEQQEQFKQRMQSNQGDPTKLLSQLWGDLSSNPELENDKSMEANKVGKPTKNSGSGGTISSRNTK
jgi:hypothetical protein